MNFRVFRFCKAIVFILALMPGFPVLKAQVASGSIGGLITDPSRGAVPQAKITLVNQGTGVERVTQSDGTGNYQFPLVAPGFYRLRAESRGFTSTEVEALEIQVAQQVKQDFRLAVGDAATKLEVTATTAVLDARSAEVGQVIGTREVVELPLNGRNYFDLAKLAPGVTELGTTSQSNGLSINGQRSNQISFFFDGVDTRTETSGRPAFTPSIEAIQEFKVQENSFAAEYGRNPSAINLTLRSGTNGFHGSVFEFLRNNQLDARSFFSPKVDPLRRNQFGAVVSGPIRRNKTFFMGNYEGLRTRRANTLFLTVPTNAQRDGNFCGWSNHLRSRHLQRRHQHADAVSWKCHPERSLWSHRQLRSQVLPGPEFERFIRLQLCRRRVRHQRW